MKRYLSTFFKAVVSIFFVYLVARNVDVSAIGSIFKNVSIPFLLWILFMEFLVTVLIAFRWYLILYDFKEKWSFFEIWKLSLIGLYFNILLPTGSGGDAVKIIYLTRNQQERLKLGTSVVFDRFIGSSTIVFMAILGIFFYSRYLPEKLKITITGLLVLVLVVWVIILSDRFASFIGSLFPSIIRDKLRAFYNHLRDYGINFPILLKVIIASMIVQILSVYVQYLSAILVSQTKMTMPFPLFFVFIPIIWLSAAVPSLGGLGIREYGYLFFFGPYLGKDTAIALSLINLLLIFFQAFLGAIAFLFFRSKHQVSE
ncbi:MAG TPA: lysylphosphatidylglycerol synthase transmembrane domain-containing protein [Candidatus Ratteibacteria bacterium]|nr:lysylphosphatidylglycerol synthase transmembrane domain-containing protein [bacterium]HON05519.1 lysylphosphatidylglycerol synthase transmembrane domain-containing protein [bacterium]HPC29943.1 lysylphosphatidylglycerol synthase transmembrane domain-containing protein [bacterium]HRS06099.1 lysylphosphatidylglycerol synthase transmembrane domain-containing protein [Candidatus Ratteibacteria bacterium]HRV04078.1 lysylphosphatidylglycerol synthase transmembrane domain-containing protein [Candid